MRGGLWYMQNVETVPTTRYQSIESIQDEIILLYSKAPQNAIPVEPRYL